MDRLGRILAGGTLAMMLGTVMTASGCRSTRNEVPPGPKYSTTGEPSSAGFNSDPRPYSALNGSYATNPAMPGAGQSGLPGSPGLGGTTPGGDMGGPPPGLGTAGAPSSFGTPPPTSPGMGMPTPNAYGPPGTSGTVR